MLCENVCHIKLTYSNTWKQLALQRKRKLIYFRLIDFVYKHNILYKNQFELQKGESTEHAISDLYCKIVKSGKNKLYNFRLCERLWYCRGQSLHLFTSYLENRTQSVKIGEHISSAQTATCGATQGSVSGPLLFLLYINDVYFFSSNVVTFHPLCKWYVCLSLKSNLSNLETDINTALQNVTNWLRANRLTLNGSISSLLLFNIANKPHDKFEIFIDQE